MEDDRTAPKRVLIVDDEEAVTLSLASLLESDAVVVRTASTWEAAMELLNAETFDLAIVDLRLGGATGMEGLELISLIKTQRPQTQVVLLTAHGSPEVEREARRRGAVDYWEKPLPIPALMGKVKALGIPAGQGGICR